MPLKISVAALGAPDGELNDRCIGFKKRAVINYDQSIVNKS